MRSTFNYANVVITLSEILSLLRLGSILRFCFVFGAFKQTAVNLFGKFVLLMYHMLSLNKFMDLKGRYTVKPYMQFHLKFYLVFCFYLLYTRMLHFTNSSYCRIIFFTKNFNQRQFYFVLSTYLI